MVEQTQETIGFWGRLEDFFLYDDQSRWKAIAWIVALTGTLGTVDLVFLDASVDDTVFLMGTVIVLMVIGWLAWYCSFRNEQPRVEVAFMSRRALVLQAGAFVVFLVAWQLPRSEEKAADRRLRNASESPASSESIDEALQVLDGARAASLRLDPNVIKQAGDRFVDAAEHTPDAWTVALQVANYRSDQVNPALVPFVGTLKKLDINN